MHYVQTQMDDREYLMRKQQFFQYLQCGLIWTTTYFNKRKNVKKNIHILPKFFGLEQQQPKIKDRLLQYQNFINKKVGQKAYVQIFYYICVQIRKKEAKKSKNVAQKGKKVIIGNCQ
eukprot:TRINITY_DN357_c0_g1_i7.p4 TRINITY_DN357_c0_g1~~TRINITY_DN357_c0_g1_i7.p4  ORF type:complete len:117 (+),score=9.79 TRINITY_DN357_c0_g1_i7:474-824(+)